MRRDTISLHDWQTLLDGGSVRRVIDESLVLRGIERNATAVWSLLLLTGYLTAADVQMDDDARTQASLTMPNCEVRSALRAMFEDQLAQNLGSSSRVVQLCRALLGGDQDVAEETLGDLALAMLSYHDVAQRPAEAVYQAFIHGLVATLERSHEVTSNREAGHGRYDVLICPRTAGAAGAVLELKVPNKRNKESAKAALRAAEAQLLQHDYAAVLRERGAGSVVQWAVVFDGKRALLRVVGKAPN